ncbi:MAG: hypothetical protein JWR59_1842 [Brevundimonas sp.]|nr:hypothetical protein [Brevundimonas sp.]
MWRRLLILALVLAPVPALAQTAEPIEAVSAGPDRAGVVVYRDRPVDTAALLERSRQPWNDLTREGLALIVERRTIDLPAGEAVIRFRGVATGIVPQSATLDGLPGDVVERNIDFDILSPGSLLKKSVGETVTVVRTNPVTGEAVEKRAILRSGPNGMVVEVDGRFEALSCSGLTERIVFDALPDGLSDQPVLSVRTRARVAGRYVVTLAYLATGLQWSADYVARLNPDGRTLALEGWLTLANFGGTGFPDAPVQVVAGTLRREDETRPVDPVEIVRQPACWPSDTTTSGPMDPRSREDRVEYNAPPAPPAPMAARGELNEIVVTGNRVTRQMAEQGELGDYKIYTLPEPTTVAARQTKQVRFLDQPRVAYDRVYRYRVNADASPEQGILPTLLLRARNDRRSGLGLALPGGSVSLFEQPGGRPLFGGQARFEDRAVGLALEWELGEAMGVTISSRAGPEKPRGALTRRTFDIAVTNDKAEAVQVEIVPDNWDARGFRILDASRPSAVGEAGYPAWTLRVAPGRTETVRFTTEIG